MAGFLENFALGAAEAGSKLYAEKSVMDRRAEIQAKRDARLESFQREQLAATKEYQDKSLGIQEKGLTATQEFRTLQETNRAAEAEAAAANRAAMLEGQTGAQEATAKYQQDMLALKEAEQSFEQSGQGVALSILKATMKAQEQSGLMPGFPGYQTPQEMIEASVAQADFISKQFSPEAIAARNGAPVDLDATTSGSKIDEVVPKDMADLKRLKDLGLISKEKAMSYWQKFSAGSVD